MHSFRGLSGLRRTGCFHSNEICDKLPNFRISVHVNMRPFRAAAKWFAAHSSLLEPDKLPQPSRVQLLFDFDSPPQTPRYPEPSAAPEPRLSLGPVARFALRFADLLAEAPNAKFDGAEIRSLAKEIFGSSAGHAAR